MNLLQLSPVQKELDEHIEKEHNLQGQDLIKKKTVALLTELFECVNEARFFKFWSHDQKPRKEVKCHACKGKGFFDFVEPFNNEHFTEDCGYCAGTGIQEKNPLLEEYVDIIHFGISLANDTGFQEYNYNDPGDADLNNLVLGLTQLMSIYPYVKKEDKYRHLALIFDYLIKLGYQLGFTEEKVINAYMEKNKENHQRQREGY